MFPGTQVSLQRHSEFWLTRAKTWHPVGLPYAGKRCKRGRRFRPLVKVYVRHLPQYMLPADACSREPAMTKTIDALAADMCTVAVV